MQASLDDDPTQTTLSSTMINWNHEKRPEWPKRHDKMILLHEIAPSHTSKLAKDTLKSLGWDILLPPPESFDLSHLRINGTRACRATLQKFRRSWKMAQQIFAAKQKQLFWRGIHDLPEISSNFVEADDQYFEEMKNEITLKIVFLLPQNRHKHMRTPGKNFTFWIFS